ncbi:MAG: ATP-binding protein [Methylococcaceae bacterium]
MSLRFQISLRILLISLFILVLGGTIAIWQARNAVNAEVDSSIKLALQLIKIGLTANSSTEMNETDWLYRFSALEQTRHLNIQLKQPSGSVLNLTRNQQSVSPEDMPPSWFINLVVSDYPEAEYQLTTFDNNPLTLIIQANPLDEITEVWQESVAFFSSILALVILTFFAVQLAFNKTLHAIGTIVASLKRIETGDYQKKLPDFSSQEYGSIARAINHMTSVLDKTQQQNHALTQHSLEIQEEERQRLAQALHDELGQSLTAIKVMAVAAAHKDADTKTITTSIVEICDHLMVVVRSMMQQLHPLVLTELGLKATLEDLVSHWLEINPSMSFTLQCDDKVDLLDSKITIQVFRVIQECLTNVIRHADASRVTINLSMVASLDSLHLLVIDNGKGCQLGNGESGFGLLGMKERINSLGGKLEIQSRPGEGMKITAQIPNR